MEITVCGVKNAEISASDLCTIPPKILSPLFTMAVTSATSETELTRYSARVSALGSIHPSDAESRLDNTSDYHVPANAAEDIPDGGYGWTVVFACSVVTFWFAGWTSAWGVVQANLLQSPQLAVSASTISFIGSLALACEVAFGLLSVRFMRVVGARVTTMMGITLLSLGVLLSSFTINNVGGLFCAAGALTGLGSCLLYATSNAVLVQWFSSKLGTANGLVKVGGGIGGTVLSVSIQALIDRIGIPWTFRVFGILILATGLPAAWLVKERAPGGSAPFVDWSLFKNMPFVFLFLAGAIGTFALFVPPFFIPLFAHSIGLPASTGAGLVAGFSFCTAIGRLGAGAACDRFGSMNCLLLTMLLNSFSILAIWPFSSTMAPLVVFAAINGIANGAFFVVMPTAIATLIGPELAAVAMGMAITVWTGGYLMGSPIAGILISMTGAQKSSSIAPYLAAIFYAGGVTFAAGACVLVARLRMDRKWIKKI
jgi:MFS family permease